MIKLKEIQEEETKQKNEEMAARRKARRLAMVGTYRDLKNNLETALKTVEKTRAKIKEFEKDPEKYQKENRLNNTCRTINNGDMVFTSTSTRTW